MSSSQRPKTPDATAGDAKTSETKAAASPSQQKITITQDVVHLTEFVKKLIPVSNNHNFIAICHEEKNKLVVYDCTSLHSSGEIKEHVVLPGNGYLAACPLPADEKKPDVEKFIAIGAIFNFLACTVWEKDANEFKFNEHTFHIKIKRSIEPFFARYSSHINIIPNTQMAAFVCDQFYYLIDLAKEQLITSAKIPGPLRKTTFCAPDCLLLPHCEDNELVAYQMTTTGLKEQGQATIPNISGLLWVWPRGNFLVTATQKETKKSTRDSGRRYFDDYQDASLVAYKIEHRVNGSIHFEPFGVIQDIAYGSLESWRRPLVINDQFVFYGNKGGSACARVFNPAEPSISDFPVLDAYSFFPTCAGLVCQSFENDVLLLPFSVLQNKEEKEKSDKKLPDALDTAIGDTLPRPLKALIASYITHATLFNPTRKIVMNEKEMISVLQSYIQKSGENKSESKGDAKPSSSRADVVKGVKRLLELLDEPTLSRHDCVEQALKESAKLKELVGTFFTSALSTEDQKLIQAIKALQKPDDPRAWYQKIF